LTASVATTVVGTPITTLPPCPSAVLISDLHVPAGGGEVLVPLQGAITAAVAGRRALFVLGDLFDSYVCRAQVRHGVWRDVAAMFAQASTAGVPIALLHGNRDFLLGPEFAAASGARIVAGGARVPIGGVDTLLLHGDELCQNDRPYQRAKRWLRSAPVRWLARNLPLRAALAAAARARAKSQMVIASGDQDRFLPTAEAVAAALATGVRRLVFGHIHRHSHDRAGAAEYWVLPAFDTSGIGLLADGPAMQPVRFLDTNGRHEATPLPAPCPFPPARGS
jgi:UDP-2,3-diacylglucosamine hydrolase